MVIDMAGQRIGKLTVIDRAGNEKNGNALWRCRCDCGKEVIASGHRLRRGERKSCGCGYRKQKREKFCEYCGGPMSFYSDRFCSTSCAAKARHHVERVEVDMSFDWKSAGQGMWHCRYQKHIQCKDRNCAKCGWNPEVAEARSKAIMEKRKAVTV
jgi:hypothetical protein